MRDITVEFHCVLTRGWETGVVDALLFIVKFDGFLVAFVLYVTGSFISATVSTKIVY